MNSHATLVPRHVRALVACLSLSVAVAVPWSAGAVVAADPSPEPVAQATPGIPSSDDRSLCESADDLRLIIGFLRETSISEDGAIPVVVGVIAGLSEARTLAGLVNETYRPLVDDLSGSLQDLRTAVETRGEQPTVGAQVASIGEAITAVGNAMDALSVRMQEPCPVEPAGSAAPAE